MRLVITAGPPDIWVALETGAVAPGPSHDRTAEARAGVPRYRGALPGLLVPGVARFDRHRSGDPLVRAPVY
jgi:hypothetical protein